MTTHPDFRSPDFLRSHVLDVMSFYGPQSVDPSGGMYHFYLDDGTVYDRTTRHLVSATRFVITCATAFELGGKPEYKERAAHALQFLENAFRDAESPGFHWTLRWDHGQAAPLDRTRHMYGLAFVMLAAARAQRIGIGGAAELLQSTYALAEQQFFDAHAGLYADDASPAGVLSGYRGQNANMHTCEALIAAFETTREPHYLARAELLAHNITVRQAALADGGVWEHYRADWSPDWDYNREDRSNIFRPWGYQPGHFTEWSKLLCQLDVHMPRPWHIPKARELFDRAMHTAWDGVHGGIHYGFAPDGAICDPAKYHWVQAESIAAAALLALRTGDPMYWTWYERIWDYCWQHFVDHQQGAWFRILTGENFNLTREKSPAGKVDYHNMGACYDVWRALIGLNDLVTTPSKQQSL
ncbi:AGE family epimerase/isomerase [Rhodoferax sp.]|uniref:AGE family epimerase/isomerase n=1 Tax=Rhodoferax sp. TaxID=50421 RepID=UPI0025CC57B8|nr:AGE family epimerase/isomerase [Rhodoferax sp.]